MVSPPQKVLELCRWVLLESDWEQGDQVQKSHPLTSSSRWVIRAQPHFLSLGPTFYPAIARNFTSFFNAGPHWVLCSAFIAEWSTGRIYLHPQPYAVTWPLGQGGSLQQDKHLHWGPAQCQGMGVQWWMRLVCLLEKLARMEAAKGKEMVCRSKVKCNNDRAWVGAWRSPSKHWLV